MPTTDVCLQWTYDYSYIKVPVSTTQVHYTEVPVGTTGLILYYRTYIFIQVSRRITELTHIQKYSYVLQIRMIHLFFRLLSYNYGNTQTSTNKSVRHIIIISKDTIQYGKAGFPEYKTGVP